MDFAVIMAGGSGTRFWPLSRKKLPKQFLPLFGHSSLLRQTYERIKPLFSDEHILIVTNRDYVELVKRELPEIPLQNIIGEPIGRNTAPCIALAAALIQLRDPQSTMTVLPADHSISDLATFHHTLILGREYVKVKNHLVTIGIKPNRPETGYGYIRYDRADPENLKTVRSFEEKPSHEKALAFIETGEYLWNSGMFQWNTATILKAFSQYLPQVSNTLNSFLSDFKPDQADISIRAFYEAVESISIDYGIMEKADQVKVIPADMGWSDVGSWMAAWELAAKDPQGNYLMGSNIELVETTNSYIQNSGKHLIAVVGLDNIVVVETADALLIMPAEKSQKVKQLIEHNLKSYGDTYS